MVSRDSEASWNAPGPPRRGLRGRGARTPRARRGGHGGAGRLRQGHVLDAPPSARTESRGSTSS